MNTLHTRITTVEELLARARAAHESIRAEPAAALTRAFEAGDALIAAKAQVAHGEWAAALASTGIPASTARLYMQLARERDRIVAAGCTSIREARQLLAGTKPRKPRTARGTRSEAPDRYEEGYAAGYRAGRADGVAAGYLAGQADAAAGKTQDARKNGSLPLDRKDLRWLVGLAHPDKHGDKVNLRATRVTQWLNELLESAQRG